MCIAISTGAALAIAGAAGAAGSIGAAVIGSDAATKAADTEAGAAEYSANLQTQLGQEGLNLDTEQLNSEEANAYPFLEQGYGAEANLANLLGLPVTGTYQTGPTQFGTPGIPNASGGGTLAPGTGGTTTPGEASLSSLVNPSLGAKGSLLAPFGQTFTPPTEAQAAEYPGYKFQLDQGLTALQNSAAAQGNLLTGQTQTAINNYAQNAAQTDYTNVYNQQLQQFQQAYNIYQNQQANEFNRLSALAGGGQTQAAQLASSGNQVTGQIGNLLQGTGAAVSSDLQNAASARASGYINSANAYGGALSSLSNLAYLPLASTLLQNQNQNLTPMDQD